MSYSPNAAGVPAAARTVITDPVQNNTGSTIAKFIPVKITSGGLALMNPSLQADFDGFAGLTRASVPNLASVEVHVSGRFLDTGLGFAVGDNVFLSKSGGLTNVRPSLGVGGFVAGDYVIRIGTVLPNVSNPLLRDVMVAIERVGRL